MTVYSFRAECDHDINMFESKCAAKGFGIENIAKWPDDDAPDVEVQFESSTGLEDLRGAMREIEDGHVMVQTLRECSRADNSMIRDHDL